MKALVIGAAASGSGKTSVTLGLTAALKRRGLAVQTFKVGPDFLDPTYLQLVSGRECYNLDQWMTGSEYIQELFVRAAAMEVDGRAADVCLIEGVMGLYDGIAVEDDLGSTAAVARSLGVPVFLLASCKAMARSFAALISGFTNFPGAPEFLGVGANMAGSVRHGQIIGEALNSLGTLPPYIGALVKGAVPELPSRHLGLVSADVKLLSTEIITMLADGVEEAFDIELLLARAREFSLSGVNAWSGLKREYNYRIGIAKDEAFHFYYPDNLQALRMAGCELVEFSPLTDNRLPDGLDAVYIGGGYPECEAERLAGNDGMRESIREFAGSGKVLYAECGGLMYLSTALQTLSGDEYAMCGVLPFKVRMLERFKTLGYIEAEVVERNIFGRPGVTLRGHEYHYSEVVGELPEDWRCTYAFTYGREGRAGVRAEGYARDGVLVSYLHAHLAANKVALEGLLESIGQRK